MTDFLEPLGSDHEPSPPERLDMVLRPAEGTNPPGLLQAMVDWARDLCSVAADALVTWVRAKGDVQAARAELIRAKAFAEIAKVEIERQRLVDERNRAAAAVALKSEIAKREFEQTMLDRQAEALQKVLESIQRLRAMGVEFDMQVVQSMIEAIQRKSS